MNDNMELWAKWKKPPGEALKKITGGRLKGMTDISPVWRYEALTKEFGPCGTGWHYEIKRLWLEDGQDGQKFAFAEIDLYVKDYLYPIPGIGGSMLLVNQQNGLYHNDEAFKMAVTDALSTACKMLGIGADVYRGRWDGNQYLEPDDGSFVTEEQALEINKLLEKTGADIDKFFNWIGAETTDTILAKDYKKAIGALRAKERQAA